MSVPVSPGSAIVVRQSGQRVPLAEAALTIGRHAQSDLVLDDSQASRHHARIEFQDGAYVLSDQGSTNGTFVNDARLTGPQVLRDGDVIRLGETLLDVHLAARAGEARTLVTAMGTAAPPAAAVVPPVVETRPAAPPLPNRQFAYDVFVSYAAADAAWTEGFFLDALEAAGVRCHSEAAFALGVPRLVEFERAVRDSGRTLLVLSTAYLVSAFSQFTDLLAQQYGLETTTWPVIPLLLEPNLPLPPRLAMLVGVDASTPAQAQAAVARLCLELSRPAPAPSPRPPCPYPGMVPFFEADAARFYGRDDEIEDLLNRLRLHPFLAVIGPSGSGKSSLVLAGLLPALRSSGLFGPGGWLVRTLRPGAVPLAALQAALHDLADGVDSLARPGEPAVQLSRLPPEASRLLLVVDQFEEVFTLSGEGAAAFQSALSRLAHVPGVYVVLTIRADFYSELMASPLWPDIQAHRAEVLPLDADGLRQAIINPAEGVGVFVETVLVERLTADAAGEPGILPLVQETLVLLWEKLERRFLPLRAYQALVLPIGAYGQQAGGQRSGLQVAIARRADAALAALGPAEQSVARRIFVRLVQFGEGRADTRRQQPVAALRTAGEDARVFDLTVEHLAGSRLLTLAGEEKGEGRRVDIAHEALISGWPALQGWLAERRETEQARRRLEAKVAEWERLGRGSGGLLDEVELLEVERWLPAAQAAELGISAGLPALAEASRAAVARAAQEQEAVRARELAQARALAEEQQRRADTERQRADDQARSGRRLRRLAGVLAAVFLLALVAAIAAALQTGAANRSRETAVAEGLFRATREAEALQAKGTAEAEGLVRATKEAEALQAKGTAEAETQRANRLLEVSLSAKLAAQGLGLLDQRPDLAALLSAEGYQIDQNLETRGSLFALSTRWPYVGTILRGHPSGEWFGEVWDVEFDLDGKRLASASSDGTVIVWDAASGRRIGQPLTGLGNATQVAVSGNKVAAAQPSGRDKAIAVWDIGSSPPVSYTLADEITYARSDLDFSPDGRLLACLHTGGQVLVWDVTTSPAGTPALLEFPGNPRALVFSADGERLMVAYSNGQIVSRRAATGEALDTVYLGGSDTGYIQAISRDGRSVVLAQREDNTLRLWDVGTGLPAGPPVVPPPGIDIGWLGRASGEVLVVGPNSDVMVAGGWVAAKGGGAQVVAWNTATGQMIGLPITAYAGNESFNGLAVSGPDKMVTAGIHASPVLWDLTSFSVYSAPLGAEIDYVLFGPDDQILGVTSGQENLDLWDVVTGRPATSTPDWGATGVSFVLRSTDSRTLALVAPDGTVTRWDAAAGRLLGNTQVPDLAAILAQGSDKLDWALSPQAATLAVTTKDEGPITTWDLVAGARGASISDPEGCGDLELSPDATTLAVACPDIAVRLWRISDGALLRTLPGPSAAWGRVVYSPDDRLLAVGLDNGRIDVWSIESGTRVAELAGHAKFVTDLAFNDDGSLLASIGDFPERVIVWDVAAGRQLGMPWSDKKFTSVTFSPDGRFLVTYQNEVAAVWDMEPESWLRYACRVTNHNLSLSEWSQFVGPDVPYRCTCPELPPGDGTGLSACPAR